MKSVVSFLFIALIWGAPAHAGHSSNGDWSKLIALNLELMEQARDIASGPAAVAYWPSDYFYSTGFWRANVSHHADRAAVRHPVVLPSYPINHYQLHQPRSKVLKDLRRQEKFETRPGLFPEPARDASNHRRTTTANTPHQQQSVGRGGAPARAEAPATAQRSAVHQRKTGAATEQSIR